MKVTCESKNESNSLRQRKVFDVNAPGKVKITNEPGAAIVFKNESGQPFQIQAPLGMFQVEVGGVYELELKAVEAVADPA